jgi:bacterioferritin-associated ferredoxin
MYVCICNAVREAELRQTVRQGAVTAEQAYLRLGLEVFCAQCVEQAQEVIDDERKTCMEPG